MMAALIGGAVVFAAILAALVYVLGFWNDPAIDGPAITDALKESGQAARRARGNRADDAS